MLYTSSALSSMHKIKAHEDRKMEKDCAPFPMASEVAIIDVCHESGSIGIELVAPLFGHSRKDYENILIYAARLLLPQGRLSKW